MALPYILLHNFHPWTFILTCFCPVYLSFCLCSSCVSSLVEQAPLVHMLEPIQELPEEEKGNDRTNQSHCALQEQCFPGNTNVPTSRVSKALQAWFRACFTVGSIFSCHVVLCKRPNMPTIVPPKQLFLSLGLPACLLTPNKQSS